MGRSTGVFDIGGQRLAATPIRGRAGELKVIGGLIAALAQGRGGVLVIEGPPGIGKSRLLTEVLALAHKHEVRSLFGEAFEYQQAVPFSRYLWPPCAPTPQSAMLRRCAVWAARRICTSSSESAVDLGDTDNRHRNHWLARGAHRSDGVEKFSIARAWLVTR